MNVLQRMAAKVLPEAWFTPAATDQLMGTRIGMTVTPAEITTRLQTARYGDTRYLSALKSEMRALDGDIESHIGKLEARLCQAPVELVPSCQEAMTDEILAYSKAQLLDPDLRLDLAIKHALWGLLDGHAGFQMIVKPDGKRFRLKSLDPVPSERFWWLAGTTRMVVQPGEISSDYVFVEEIGDVCPVLVVDPHVMARDRVGLLRPCFAPWVTKLHGFDWWARNVELTGIPFRKVKYKGGVDLAKLERQIRGMGTAGYSMFPDGVDMEFISTALGSRNAHEDLAGYCDREKAKILLGSTQTADVQKGSGSQSTSEVHERGLEIRADSLGKAVTAFLRAKVLKPLVRMSYGEDVAERLTPNIVLRVKSTADLLTFFQAMETAGKAGMKTVPVEWVHEQTGIPVPEDDDEVLEYAAPAPAVAAKPAGEDPEDTAEPPEDPNEPPDPEDQGEPPEPPDPKAKAAAVRRAAARAARRPPAALLDELEAWALKNGQGAGAALVAPYAAIVDEVLRDGGDLGHLMSRVRIQAQIQGTAPQETADIMAMVCAHALLTGFNVERS